jgi:hypothetical protein
MHPLLATALLLGGCLSPYEVTGEARGEWERQLNRWRFVEVEQHGCLEDRTERAAVMPVDGQGGEGGVVNIRDCEFTKCGTRETTREDDCHLGTCNEGDISAGACSRSEKGRTVKLCRPRSPSRDEVMGMRCTWDTWEWQLVDQQRLYGEDFSPQWPTGAVEPAGPLERIEKSERYVVHVTAEGKEAQLHYNDEETFLQFAGGKVTAQTSSDSMLLTQVRPAP